MRTIYKAGCRFAQYAKLPVPAIDDMVIEGMVVVVLAK
jgi:hypothetical protein